MLFFNFKTYNKSTGEGCSNLLRIISEASSTFPIIAAVQAVDLRNAVTQMPGAIWAQHVDLDMRGRATGKLLPEVAKEIGANGTFLNHSEHKLEYSVLVELVLRCKELGLKTLVFAASVEECIKVSELSPDYIGYEPPELIASKETSVARAKPEIIEKVVQAVSNIPIIVGAGVKDAEDVRVSLKLGAKGVALASAFVLAENPKAVLEDLLNGFGER